MNPFPSAPGLLRALLLSGSVSLAVLALPVAVAAAPEPAGSARPGTHAPENDPPPRVENGPLLDLRATVFHTELEATYPAADSLHTRPVSEVRLRFSTEVQLALSALTVIGPDGVLRDAAQPDTVPGSGGRELSVSFSEPLPSGAYTVEWRTAGPDGHGIEGSFGFGIRRPPPLDTMPPQTPSDSAALAPVEGAPGSGPGVRPVGIAVRLLSYLALVGMLGTPVFRLLVVPSLSRRTGPEAETMVERVGGRLRLLAWVVAAVAVMAVPLRLWNQLLTLFGGGEVVRGASGSTFWHLLQTPWGAAWILQGALTAFFVVGLLLGRGAPKSSRRGWFLMLLAGLAAAVVPALSGHSVAAAEGLRTLAVANEALHVAAAGTWIGGLGALVLVGIGVAGATSGPGSEEGEAEGEEEPEAQDGVGEGDGKQAHEHEVDGASPDDEAEDAGGAGLAPLAALVGAFSRVALVAVAVLLATGVVNAWLQVGSPGALFTTRYGVTLLLKVVAVGGVAALGFYNWRVVRPSLERDPRPGLIRVPATLELALGLLVLAVTAALVVTPPPGS